MVGIALLIVSFDDDAPFRLGVIRIPSIVLSGLRVSLNSGTDFGIKFVTVMVHGSTLVGSTVDIIFASFRFP